MADQKRLAESVEEYLLWRRATCAAATVKNEGFVLRRFVAWYGDVQLRHMTPERVADWFFGANGLRQPHVTRDGVHREPVAATTANFYRIRLASFFRWATRRGLLRRDLLGEVQALPTTRRTRLQVPPEGLLRLLEVVPDGRDRAFIALLVNTGFRAGTATRLRCGDIDLGTGTISVLITKSHVEDDFPITLDLDQELRRWLRRYALDVGRPLRPTDHLFPAREGGVYRWTTSEDGERRRQRTDPSWVPERPMTHTERVVQGGLRALGLPTQSQGAHTIRRSFARSLFDSMSDTTGYDAALRTVAASLHHRSSATTEIYLGMTSERSRRDGILRGTPFLTAMVGTVDNVVALRPAEG